MSIHAEVLSCTNMRFVHVDLDHVEHDSAVPVLAAVANMKLGFASHYPAKPSAIRKAAHSAHPHVAGVKRGPLCITGNDQKQHIQLFLLPCR